MTSAQVVETSVNVISNSPSQDYTHPDDRTLLYKLIDIDNGVVLMTVKVMFKLYSESNHYAKFPFRAHVSVTTTPA